VRGLLTPLQAAEYLSVSRILAAGALAYTQLSPRRIGIKVVDLERYRWQSGRVGVAGSWSSSNPGIAFSDACMRGPSKPKRTALETKLRNDLFATERLGLKPEIGLEDAILKWLETVRHKKDQRNPGLNARHLSEFVAGKSLREAPEAARDAVGPRGRSRLRRGHCRPRL
jgi:hypothetical protein